MTPDAKKKAQKFFTTLLVIAGLVIVGLLGYTSRPGIDNFTGRTKAAITAFSGSTPPKQHQYSSASATSRPAVVTSSRKNTVSSSPQKRVEEISATERKRVVIDLFFWNTKNVFNATPIQREMILENKWQIAGPVLKELFEGPNEKELKDGWTSAIKPGTTLEKVTIQDGTARVWIKTSSGETLKDGAAIEQIKRTLKQFQSVRRVQFEG